MSDDKKPDLFTLIGEVKESLDESNSLAEEKRVQLTTLRDSLWAILGSPPGTVETATADDLRVITIKRIGEALKMIRKDLDKDYTNTARGRVNDLLLMLGIEKSSI